MSDSALLKVLGEFIRYHRLKQNRSQDELAREAGINRTTLSSFERGKHSTTKTFIQLLRILNLLYVLEQFQVQKQISPILLAKLERKERRRASGAGKKGAAPRSDRR